jgi:hypothetical protein
MAGNHVTKKPSGPYLIESAPHYRKRCVCLAMQRFAIWPSSIVRQIVAAYHDELQRALDADSIYLGPGK